jgi:hypothetical protein
VPEIVDDERQPELNKDLAVGVLDIAEGRLTLLAAE